jgi:hypothetical protein
MTDAEYINSFSRFPLRMRKEAQRAKNLLHWEHLSQENTWVLVDGNTVIVGIGEEVICRVDPSKLVQTV